MGRFKSPCQAQRLLSVHDQAASIFRPKRHRLNTRSYRHARSDAFAPLGRLSHRVDRLNLGDHSKARPGFNNLTKPYVGCMIAAIVLLCIVPGLALWLPNPVMGVEL